MESPSGALPGVPPGFGTGDLADRAAAYLAARGLPGVYYVFFLTYDRVELIAWHVGPDRERAERIAARFRAAEFFESGSEVLVGRL